MSIRNRRKLRRLGSLAAVICTIGAVASLAAAAQASPAARTQGVMRDRALASSRVAARAAPASASVVAPVMTCAELAQADFSTIPGASTTIFSAIPVTASANPLGDYAGCEVNGLIAPQEQFQLMLPTQTYTGGYLQLGCGGYCGSDVLGTPAASYGCAPVTGGQFAEATDNEGHTSGAVFSGAFGADPTLRAAFGYQSEHLMATAAKAIIAAFYDHRPAESYFDGCSQGGHEGLLEAQRYPTDFNGIIAGAPASILTPLNIFYQAWNALANTGPHGAPILTMADLGPLHAAVIKACDALDGTRDGLIADPFACKWDPGAVQCRAGQVSTAASFCLTPAQVATVRKLYEGPRTPSGQLLYPGWQLRGSEDNWAGWIVPVSGPESNSIDWGIATQTIKYLMFKQATPSLTIHSIQFTTAFFSKMMGPTAGIWDATDPDLRAFRDHGGKLILWQGLADPAISPVGTIAYYTAVERYMGGAAQTRKFARLFMLPGVSHCGGGDGPDSFDGLSALVRWVETGKAPTSMLTSKVVNGTVTQTRPVYEYPLIAVDTTGGPVTQASSYTPQNPPVRFDGNVQWAGSFSSGYEQVCGWVNGRWVCRPGKSGTP